MKIYDCFMYNNEDLILEIRLNYLDEYVEKFIIIESKFDHQGNQKKKFFNIKKFLKFKNKIRYILIEKFPQNLNCWKRENYQRNYITKALNDVDNEDYVMISDIDEIPNVNKFKKISYGNYSVFEQKNFFYKFNLINKTIPLWYGSKICKKKFLKSPQWLRSQKVKKFSLFRFYRTRWNIIKNVGWHFSFIMAPKDIQKKIKSFAHSEFNTENFTNLRNIKKRVEQNLDIFDRNQIYQRVSLDSGFPEYIKKNFKRFKLWIL